MDKAEASINVKDVTICINLRCVCIRRFCGACIRRHLGVNVKGVAVCIKTSLCVYGVVILCV